MSHFRSLLLVPAFTCNRPRTAPTRRTPARLGSALLVLLLLAVVGSAAAAPARRAAWPGTAYVVTTTGTSGAGSLTQAILDANAHPGADTIAFAIPGTGVHTILVNSSFVLSDTVSLDGTTQPGYTGLPLIELTSSGAFNPGLTVTADNVTILGLTINGFYNGGILVSGGSGAVISGNFIGTDPTGTQAMANSDSGIRINGASGALIGGTAPSARNLIAGNNGTAIVIQNSTGVQVQGNYLGTDVSGQHRLANTGAGVALETATGNTVGGTAAGARNLISGNNIGLHFNLANNNLVLGNYIGLDVTGSAAIANNYDGLEFYDSAYNTVGGTTASSRNIISASGDNGILINENNAGTSIGNVITGNYIGTDATGTQAVGNMQSGVAIRAGSQNVVGGTTPGAGNLVSGNGIGVYIECGAIGALSNTLVAGNYIGTDAAGTGALGNTTGMYVACAPGTTIGGTSPGARNVIAANGGPGIQYENVTAGGATRRPANPPTYFVEGNYIGVGADGVTPLGNTGQAGISVATSNVAIGGGAGAGNRIAYNSGPGVRVVNGATGVPIRGNAVYGNGGLGVDLNGDGVTLNDACDPDVGANLLQNYPVLSEARSLDTSVTITGTLNSTASMTYTLEFFANVACHPSGYGEGQTLLGTATVSTDPTCNQTFQVTLPVAVPSGQYITASATDANGNTSEFSACLLLASGPTATPTPVRPTATTVLPSATRPPASPTVPPSATRPPASATVPPASPTRPPLASATPCVASFSDVHPTDYFYTPVRYLACHGVISGYGDGTFRPYQQTTRGQMVKIVVLGFQKAISTPAGGAHTFADVAPTFPFFAVIETAAVNQIVSGYTCGGPGELCDPQGRPYFRPYANVTRGQLSKIAVSAAGWALQTPPAGTFADVLPGSAFYPFVATAACHGVISGYACGGPGEPCDAQHRPYFRAYNPAARGQIAKIVYLAATNLPGACPIPTTGRETG